MNNTTKVIIGLSAAAILIIVSCKAFAKGKQNSAPAQPKPEPKSASEQKSKTFCMANYGASKIIDAQIKKTEKFGFAAPAAIVDPTFKRAVATLNNPAIKTGIKSIVDPTFNKSKLS